MGLIKLGSPALEIHVAELNLAASKLNNALRVADPATTIIINNALKAAKERLQDIIDQLQSS